MHLKCLPSVLLTKKYTGLDQTKLGEKLVNEPVMNPSNFGADLDTRANTGILI